MQRMLLGLALLLVMGASSALAANPEPFNVQITIRQAITITKVSDLDFGTVETGAATYTVTPTAGAQAGAGSGAVAAEFDVTGETGQNADVILGANPVTITCSAGACTGNTLSVNLTPSTAIHNFTGGTDQIYVGGDVTLLAGTLAGLYVGSTTVSLVYQ